jgi:hypothetical protein
MDIRRTAEDWLPPWLHDEDYEDTTPVTLLPVELTPRHTTSSEELT